MYSGFRCFCSSKLEMNKGSPFCKSIMNMHCLLEASSKTKPKHINDGFSRLTKQKCSYCRQQCSKKQEGVFHSNSYFPKFQPNFLPTKECYPLFSTSVFCDLVIFIISATERLRNLVEAIQISVIIWINSFLHLRCWR